jgi:hypothetical protein
MSGRCHGVEASAGVSIGRLQADAASGEDENRLLQSSFGRPQAGSRAHHPHRLAGAEDEARALWQALTLRCLPENALPSLKGKRIFTPSKSAIDCPSTPAAPWMAFTRLKASQTARSAIENGFDLSTGSSRNWLASGQG